MNAFFKLDWKHHIILVLVAKQSKLLNKDFCVRCIKAFLGTCEVYKTIRGKIKTSTKHPLPITIVLTQLNSFFDPYFKSHKMATETYGFLKIRQNYVV